MTTTNSGNNEDGLHLFSDELQRQLSPPTQQLSPPTIFADVIGWLTDAAKKIDDDDAEMHPNDAPSQSSTVDAEINCRPDPTTIPKRVEDRPPSTDEATDIMLHYYVKGIRIVWPLKNRLRTYFAFVLQHQAFYKLQHLNDEQQESISFEDWQLRLVDTWAQTSPRERRVYEALSRHHNKMRFDNNNILRKFHCAHCFHHNMFEKRITPHHIPKHPVWMYYSDHEMTSDKLDMKDVRTQYSNGNLQTYTRSADRYNIMYQERLLDETKCDECESCCIEI